jgi:hypothetical protein
MCRSIRTLHNFSPPATDEEVRAVSLQFVRKISGTIRPSRANQQAFDRAVDDVARAARTLLGTLTTSAPPRIARSSPPRRACERRSDLGPT